MISIITGSSCNLKTTIGEILGETTGYQFVRSDSDQMDWLRSANLINWNFKTRLLMRYYLLRNLSDIVKSPNLLVERSMLDQLVFCKIVDKGWYELDKELDNELILKDEQKWLNLERMIQVKMYYIINNQDVDFIKMILSDPTFYGSKRSDTFWSVDDYFKFQEMYTDIYIRYVKLMGKRYQNIIIAPGTYSTNGIQGMIDSCVNQIKKSL